MRDIVVTPRLTIPAGELAIAFARSGGPGGQNVNKVATRIELEFDVEGSAVLTESQKERIRARLATRMSRVGVLRVVAQSERTQARNEAEARRRLASLLDHALAVPRPRRPTRPTAASRHARIEDKRRQSARKRERRTRPEE